MLFLSFILFITNPAFAKLQVTDNENALCSDGQQAKYTKFTTDTNNWLIYVQGGGVAPNADAYRGRLPSQKSPPSDDNFGYHYPIVKDFHQKGFNVVVIPYCSSDLHQGNHSHMIDGVEVHFKGRVIFEDVINQLDDELASSDKLIFAGYSAGAIGLGFNADIIARYKNAMLLADSFWLDQASLDMRLGFNGGRWDAIVDFLYPNMPEHCKQSHWANCFPTRTNFERFGLKKIFPIWNIGDRYAAKDRDKTRKATFADITYYDAGFTMDAEMRGIKGFEEWGHVMTANALYTTFIEGVRVRDLIWNWVEGTSPTLAIFDENPIPVMTQGNEFILKADEQTGFTSHHFYNMPKNDHNFTYITDASKARAGKAFQRFELREGDCFPNPNGGWNDCKMDRERFEFASRPEQNPSGKECYGYSLKLDKDFVSLTPTNTDLGQVHQIGGPEGTAGGLKSFPPLIQIGVTKDHLMFGWHELTGSAKKVNDEKREYKLKKLQDMKGVWTDISFCLDYDGKRMEAWVDGKRKVKINKSPINFVPKKTYFKYGIYRSFISRHKAKNGTMPTQIVFYDEVRRGNSVESVDRNINPDLPPVD